MAEVPAQRLDITVRFPLGAYHAQSLGDFDTAEWPPHPVRVIAALIAGIAQLDARQAAAAREAISLLCESREPPLIAAPRLNNEQADGQEILASYRGASRWAPRNHQLSELGKGIHPRELGRTRAEISKVAVGVGDRSITFSWPVELSEVHESALRRAAAEVTVVGTSRSPAIVDIARGSGTSVAREIWAPVDADESGGVEVRVPTPSLPAVLDAWHASRSGPPRRNGAPAPAGFIPPASLGRRLRYRHGSTTADAAAAVLDPRWWGDMLVVQIDRDSPIRPKGQVAFALARALRAAMLSTFSASGSAGEAPAVLRGRGGEAHAAFIPLPFVGYEHADGGIRGVAILLPHHERRPEVLVERRDVERGLRPFVVGGPAERTSIGVPGVGNVLLGHVVPGRVPLQTLQERRWRRPAQRWSTVTPVVHSRFRRNDRPDSLLQQVSADCADVGLPQPVGVEVRRASRFTGAPLYVSHHDLPERWAGPLRGPTEHLELTFDRKIAGPIVLGRARHFGLGLCLPVPEEQR